MNSKFYTLRLIGLFLMMSIYQMSFAQIPTDGLVGYYMLDGNAADSSGMAHDGTIVGALSSTTNRFEEADKAYSFDGGHIDCGNPIAYQMTDAISIAAWIKPTSIPDWVTIVSRWGGTPNGGYYLGINPATSGVRFNLNDPGPVESSAVMIDEWLHVAVTYDGDSVKVYLDGAVSASKAYDQPMANPAADFYIGQQFNFPIDEFIGSMDDILIYNRGLSQEEVELIYGTQVTYTENIFLDRSVDVFPNPTKGTLSIQNNSDIPIQTYSLFNATGMIVKTAAFQEELDINDQPNGIYYLILNFDDTSTTMKIIKQYF